MSLEGSKKIYLVIALVTFLKILFQFIFPHPIHLWEDHDMAVNLVNTGDLFYQHDGIKNYTYQFPIYPFVISLLYKCFGLNPLLATLFNILLNGVSAVLLFHISRKIISLLSVHSLEKNVEKVSFIVVFLFLLHPAINYYALYHVHPFSENLFFLLAVMFVSLHYLEKNNLRFFLLLSFVLALAMLDRGTVIVAIVPFFILYYQRNGFGKALKLFVTLGITSFLFVLPWFIRNYEKDHFIGFESVSGKDMWKGTLENSDGSNYLSDGRNYYSALTIQELDSLGKLSVTAQNHFFMSKIHQSWNEHPLQMVKLFFLKLKNFWWFRSSIGNELPDAFKLFISAYEFIYTFLLLFTGFFFTQTFRKSFPFLCMLILLSVLQSLFYVETRHRIILEPFLIFFAVASGFIAINKYPDLK